MRIAILSDIHSNCFALSEVLSFLEKEAIHHYFILGDQFGYYPWASDTWKMIEPLLSQAHVLLGNHDELLVIDTPPAILPEYWDVIQQNKSELPQGALEWLHTLKPTLNVDIDGITFTLAHGTPENPLNGRFYPDNEQVYDWFPKKESEVVVLGHTHYPLERSVNGGLIINPGSVGQPRDGFPTSSICIFDTNTRTYTFHRVEYPVDATIDKLEKMNWYQRGIDSLIKNKNGRNLK